MDDFDCFSSSKILSTEEVSDKTGPYLKTKMIVERTEYRMNPDFPDDAKCDCGHPYERHFDPYEQWAPVGCKYCQCHEWIPPVQKAGIIPYQLVNSEIQMMFMIPSDPNYGGSKPQIAKGFVDDTDKGSKAAAIREGGEELGLDMENVKYGKHSVFDVFKGTIMDEKEYTFALYTCEIIDRSKFNTPHFETGAVVWMTARQFMEIGKEKHKDLVKKTFVEVAKQLGFKEIQPTNHDDFQEVTP